MGGCLAPISPPRLTRPSREPGRRLRGEPSPAAYGGGSSGGSQPRRASSPSSLARSRESRKQPSLPPPGSRPHPTPGRQPRTPLSPGGLGTHLPRPGVRCRAGRRGRLTAAASSGGAGSPGLRLSGLRGGVRGAGGARRPCSLRLDWSPASNPSPRRWRGGGDFQKKAPTLPGKIPVMGVGRRKPFRAGSAEPTGLHPASAGRRRHKAAPPVPSPAPPRPMAGPGRGLGRPGLAALGRRWRRRRPGRRAAPPRPGSEGRNLEGQRAAGPVGAGAGAGAEAAFLETLAKYSQRIGAFLEMRRRRQPRPVRTEPGVLQTGGAGEGEIPRFQYPRGPEEGARLGLPRGARAGSLQMRSRDPSAGVPGCPNRDTSSSDSDSRPIALSLSGTLRDSTGGRV